MITLPVGEFSAEEIGLLHKYPAIRRVLLLRDDGDWRFRWSRVSGELGLLAGVRLWADGWHDAMAILDVHDAKAFRCDHAGGEVWCAEGTLTDVLDGLVDLPAPDHPSAPRLVRACADRLWTPR